MRGDFSDCALHIDLIHIMLVDHEGSYCWAKSYKRGVEVEGVTKCFCKAKKELY